MQFIIISNKGISEHICVEIDSHLYEYVSLYIYILSYKYNLQEVSHQREKNKILYEKIKKSKRKKKCRIHKIIQSKIQNQDIAFCTKIFL